MKKQYLLVLIIIVAALNACVKKTDVVQKKEEKILTKAEITLNKMTLEEKVCQLFIVAPISLHSNDSVFLDNLKKYPVGGFLLFADDIQNPTQITDFNKEIQANTKYPLLVCVDEEGGDIARIANNPNFSVAEYADMQSVGATNDEQMALVAGETIAAYLKEYGFNLNFAPVTDINSNPDNTVIGKRSFGNTPHLVSSMARAFLQGMHRQNVMGCIKHFPGHGDTKADSHSDYVAIEKNWMELKQTELIPFIENFTTTDMIMVAHITCTNVTNEQVPASLSYELLTDKLRNELGYKGVIITDALNMGAITENFSADQASLRAFKAGSDLILMPEDFETAYSSILQSVQNGEISEARVNESVLRILSLKEKYKLLK